MAKEKKLIVGIMRSVNIFFHAFRNNNNNSQTKKFEKNSRNILYVTKELYV